MLGVIVDSPITVVQTAEKRGAYSVGYHYLGAQKFAPRGWISGIAFTWGNLYTAFARQVLDGTWKSENILGNLGDDFLTIAPFGPAVPADAVRLVNAKKQELPAGSASRSRAAEGQSGRRAGQGRRDVPADRAGKMDWLVEGVIGQPRLSALSPDRESGGPAHATAFVPEPQDVDLFLVMAVPAPCHRCLPGPTPFACPHSWAQLRKAGHFPPHDDVTS